MSLVSPSESIFLLGRNTDYNIAQRCVGDLRKARDPSVLSAERDYLYVGIQEYIYRERALGLHMFMKADRHSIFIYMSILDLDILLFPNWKVDDISSRGAL